MSSGSVLSFPATIYRGRGALHNLQAAVEKLGSRVFILGGKTALSVTLPLIAFDSADIVATAWFGGEVTERNIQPLAAQISDTHADVIIAVGGGKALDTGKMVAELTQKPLITIPTIAATCSAVSTVSVLYDESGHYQGLHKLKKAPDVVILDVDLIAKAPLRWLSAGLGDTLAKFYEYRVISGGNPDCSMNMSAFSNGVLCHQIISRFGKEACNEVMNGVPTNALEQVMDAIFIYAGFTSIMGIGDHVAAAHALFDGFTVLEKTRDFGHGLLVGFGNLCLLALENRSDDEIREAIALARDCGVPVSLSEIAELDDAELTQILMSAINTPDMANMPFTVTPGLLLNAVERVNRLAEPFDNRV